MNNLNYERIEFNEKKEKFTNLVINKSIIDGRLIAVNKKYLGVSYFTNGEIALIDSSKPHKIENSQHRIKINNSSYKIQDIEFSPFNDNILASAYENNSVLIWKIPEGDIKENITKEFQIYKKHTNKVNYVTFNPIVDNLLCSDSSDEIHIWNIEKGDNYIKFKTYENSSMISWDPNGDLIGVTTKKQLLNIFDPRNNKMIFEQKINEGYMPPKFAWIDNNLFATTGSDNKKNVTMLKLWDIRKQKDPSLNEGEISSIEINKAKYSFIPIPFINKEIKLIYLIEKDKSKINLYNYNENKIINIKDYDISEASICSVLFNRQLLEKNKKEIDRFAICSNSINNKNTQKIFYSSFYLPKDCKISDSILYPFERKNIILTYEKWITEKNSAILENNNIKENVNENDNKNDKNKFKNINKNEQTEKKIKNEIDKKIENEEKKLINEENDENEINKLYNDLLNKNEKLKKKK